MEKSIQVLCVEKGTEKDTKHIKQEKNIFFAQGQCHFVINFVRFAFVG